MAYRQPNRFGRLKVRGGNSIRIRDDNETNSVLNETQRLGLTVLMDVGVERAGVDNTNQRDIDRQFARIRKLAQIHQFVVHNSHFIAVRNPLIISSKSIS